MKLFDFIIVRFVICLALGIFIGHQNILSTSSLIIIIIFFLIVLGLLRFISKARLKKRVWYGCITYITVCTIGILSVNFHDQSNFKNHYSQLNFFSDEAMTLEFKVRRTLKPNNFNKKYIIEVLKTNDVSTCGNVLLNIKNDSLFDLQIDDIYSIKTRFQPIKKPLNPYQFDYGGYLQKQYVYHQIFSEPHLLYRISDDKHTLTGLAELLRTTIQLKLSAYNFKTDELAIISALLLGQRHDISAETYASFTNAGVIHILAVSGLHVGILLILLNFICSPLERIKHGKVIKTVIILLCLWSFALVAGLSASVTRAVTMFSVVAIGMNLNRPTNIYNTLAISAFLLLLFKPMFLFDVGFQMSYLAVVGIVSLQPMFYKLWSPKLYILDKFWQILTVSIAAQIGVLPISLFYFHQFPGLFIVSNLVVIPFLSVLLGGGILVIILALCDLLPTFLASLYASFISYLQDFISWVSQFENFIIKDITFGISFVIACYVLIITATQYFKNPNSKSLKIALLAIVGFQATFIHHKLQLKHKSEVVIFNKTKYTIIGQANGNALSLFTNLENASDDYTISNYTTGNALQQQTVYPVPSLFQINDKKLVVIDSLALYDFKTIAPEYILLTQSPRLNLDRLIDSIQPKVIISDGSNYTSYEKRWEETCLKRKLPFHQTRKKGAFIIKL